MNTLTLAAQTIKESVSALEVGHAIGLDVDKHGRCPCPFHNGKDRNMKLFPGNRGFTCFVCHETGDVIKLAQLYYGTSFPDTIRWFNDAFHLGMDIESPLSKEAVKQAENAQRQRAAEREFQEWKEKMGFDMYLTADRILEMLEEQRDANVPKTPGEPWNQKFCEAVRMIPAARRFAESCMMKCIGVESDA